MGTRQRPMRRGMRARVRRAADFGKAKLARHDGALGIRSASPTIRERAMRGGRAPGASRRRRSEPSLAAGRGLRLRGEIGAHVARILEAGPRGFKAPEVDAGRRTRLTSANLVAIRARATRRPAPGSGSSLFSRQILVISSRRARLHSPPRLRPRQLPQGDGAAKTPCEKSGATQPGGAGRRRARVRAWRSVPWRDSRYSAKDAPSPRARQALHDTPLPLEKPDAQDDEDDDLRSAAPGGWRGNPARIGPTSLRASLTSRADIPLRRKGLLT